MYGSFLKLILKLLKCNWHGTCPISSRELVGQFPWNTFPILEFTNRNAKSSISCGLSIYCIRQFLKIDYIRKLIFRSQMCETNQVFLKVTRLLFLIIVMVIKRVCFDYSTLLTSYVMEIFGCTYGTSGKKMLYITQEQKCSYLLKI